MNITKCAIPACFFLIVSAAPAKPSPAELIPRRISGHYGYADKHNVFHIPAHFRMAKPFAEGLAAVRMSSGKWGYINEKGVIVIPAVFDEAENFHKGRARVRTSSGWAFVDQAGRMVRQAVP